MIAENVIPAKRCRSVAPIEPENILIRKIISSKITGKENTIFIAERVIRFHVKIVKVIYLFD